MPKQKQENKSVELKILEDPQVAFGHYAHNFVTSYDKEMEHYRLDFYQDSTPFPDTNRVNRRLVSRIFLTKKGLESLGGVITKLNTMICNQSKRLQSGLKDKSSK